MLARPQDTLSFSLILAASVMSLKTAVNEKIPIKDQDYEAQLASNKLLKIFNESFESSI